MADTFQHGVAKEGFAGLMVQGTVSAESKFLSLLFV